MSKLLPAGIRIEHQPGSVAAKVCDFCHCRDASRLTVHQIGGDASLTLCEARGSRLGCVDTVGRRDTARRLGLLSMLRGVDLDAFERATRRRVNRWLVSFWRNVLARAERCINTKWSDEE